MAAIHLAKAVGGDVFLGFISAVAFATILAVVAGLTLSGASAVSHELYATVLRKGQADSKGEQDRPFPLALGWATIPSMNFAAWPKPPAPPSSAN